MCERLDYVCGRWWQGSKIGREIGEVIPFKILFPYKLFSAFWSVKEKLKILEVKTAAEH